jgi:CRISPR-associated endonuclease/helicase Cas3
MKLPELQPAEFSNFFTELHGRAPFLWQQRLAAGLASEGLWPQVLNLPTGSGKTAAIDIALFHLALEADRGERRRAPLRIAFVVDRRVIVDAAYERALSISNRLAQALKAQESDNVLYRVAKRLASFGRTPVLVRALRGGVPRESDWARTPSQPTVLCSTVDQVGSRLLFRGYGVSDSMKPVHAGLVGSDCLILLDEAHLSEPFRQTLGAIETYRKQPWVELAPAPWAYVTLTATPESISSVEKTQKAHLPRIFSLTEEERADKQLALRLRAEKPTRLESVKARTNQPVAHAQALTESAWTFSGIDANGAPRAIAIVVNRVALARRCYQELASRISSGGADAEAVLFVGRTRDVDRMRLMKLHQHKIVGGRKPLQRTIFVMATQCIEAGADFDFDALVTQIGPLDSLRQRFGRVNRMGRDIPVQAMIVACADEIRANANDPLYGDRVKATWDWLSSSATAGVIDFGVDAMDAALKGVDISTLATKKCNGPVVMPAYVDLWAQTSPVPFADPEPALFLHGVPDAADVQIVWRADLQGSDLATERRERTMTLLDLMPPRAAEAVAVPIAAARAWLRANAGPPVDDTEGASVVDEEPARDRSMYAFRWHGLSAEGSGPVGPEDLRPGDVLVVPSVAGGSDEHGWNPESSIGVRDLADEAARPYARKRFVFRLHRRLLESELRGQLSSSNPDTRRSAESDCASLDRAIQEARNEAKPTEMAATIASLAKLPASWHHALEAIADCSPSTVSALFPYDEDGAERVSGVVFVARRGVNLPEEVTNQEDEAVTDNEDAGSFRSVAVELDEHSRHVESCARDFAERCALTERVTRDLAVAAFLHDEGKRDDRFQLYLRRGDLVKKILDTRVLAKSEMGAATRASDVLARRRADLPDRWRHEADSVRRALEHPKLKEAHDKLLVLWLIGTHHGYGRPMYPHSDTRTAGPQNLDFQVDGLDWIQIFGHLLRRYGPWELARLEAIVRLADHRASEAEELNGGAQRTQGRLEVQV